MKNKILVKDAKGNKRIVQASMVPVGFTYVEDYKAPRKAQEKKVTPKKSTKKEQPKKEAKK